MGLPWPSAFTHPSALSVFPVWIILFELWYSIRLIGSEHAGISIHCFDISEESLQILTSFGHLILCSSLLQCRTLNPHYLIRP